MILETIKLVNFRQFKGRQEISFSDEMPSITVIYGENGRGKTGLFRALIFSLFGERKLPQDGNIDEKAIRLVNTQALEELSGKPVDASVTTIFSHNNKKYEITRAIRGLKEDDAFFEQYLSISLVITDEKGNTKPPITNKAEINDIIGDVFDPKIKDYFLFDGEKIEDLSKATIEQKRTVAQGIKNLLNINDLETAKAGVRSLQQRLNDEAKRHSQGKLQQVFNLISQKERDREENGNKQATVTEQLAAANKEKKRLDGELDKIDEIKAIINKRKDLITRETELSEQKSNSISFMREKITIMASALLSNCLQRVYQRLDEKKQLGEIPAQSKLDLIEKILEDHRCICGTAVETGTLAHKEIIAWRNRVVNSGLCDSALDIWKDLNAVIQQTPETVENIKSVLKQFDRINIGLRDVIEKLKKISDQIDESAEEKAALFNKSLQKANQDIGGYNNAFRILKDESLQIDQSLVELNRTKEKLIQQEGIKSELDAALMIATDTFNALSEIYVSFTNNVKKQLGEFASKTMQKLLDEGGRWSLKSIVVNDDYSLQVNDYRNEPFLADISAGQRQIVSLCFITALAQVANGSTRFEFPLFMDTPFGRLSLEHRKNLIGFIPQICRQWITMVTDTELTEKEWKIFYTTAPNCKFYRLNAQKDGTTMIQYLNADDALEIIVSK